MSNFNKPQNQGQNPQERNNQNKPQQGNDKNRQNQGGKPQDRQNQNPNQKR